MSVTIIETHSTDETIEAGKKLAEKLTQGSIVALIGTLGAGKTYFVHGIAEGLSVSKEQYVSSPTYTIINEYYGKLPLYHIDLYRLNTKEEIEELGLVEYLYGNGVSVIEWADKLPEGFLDRYIKVEIQILNETDRKIIIYC